MVFLEKVSAISKLSHEAKLFSLGVFKEVNKFYDVCVVCFLQKFGLVENFFLHLLSEITTIIDFEHKLLLVRFSCHVVTVSKRATTNHLPDDVVIFDTF